MIRQNTVFLENQKGRLLALCRTLGDSGVNMHALTITESADYGLVRIICDDPDKAKAALDEADFRSNISKVSAIQIPNEPGGLADMIAVLDGLNLNIEYGYCFSTEGGLAADVFKIHGEAENAEATFMLEAAGFKVLKQGDL